MMDLYRRNGGEPVVLPVIAFTSEGLSRTDLANQPESRDELGYVFFATIDPTRQRPVLRKGEWVVELIPAEPPPLMAGTVTMRQAKLQLLRAGLLDRADAAIAAMEGIEGRAAQIEWASATTLRRDHPLVAALGTQLGLTDEQIDGLFAAAAQIP